MVSWNIFFRKLLIDATVGKLSTSQALQPKSIIGFLNFSPLILVLCSWCLSRRPIHPQSRLAETTLWKKVDTPLRQGTGKLVRWCLISSQWSSEVPDCVLINSQTKIECLHINGTWGHTNCGRSSGDVEGLPSLVNRNYCNQTGNKYLSLKPKPGSFDTHVIAMRHLLKDCYVFATDSYPEKQ